MTKPLPGSKGLYEDATVLLNCSEQDWLRDGDFISSEKASWSDEGPVGFGEFIVLMAAVLQDCMCSDCPALSCSIDHCFDSCWFIYLLDNNLLNKALLW